VRTSFLRSPHAHADIRSISVPRLYPEEIILTAFALQFDHPARWIGDQNEYLLTGTIPAIIITRSRPMPTGGAGFSV
jgi:hypothetical protein